MTIAIGLLASDGIVVAADTQETIPGYWKNDQGKILFAGVSIDGPIPDVAHCAITGAGNGEHIDAVAKLLSERFLGSPALATSEQVGAAFADVLNTFHAKHILPFAAYPREERPGFNLLIACHFGRRPSGLYISQENVLLQRGPYEAVGSGAAFANTLLSRLYRLPLLRLWEAALLASYVMYQVKESVDYCGKSTDMSLIGRQGQIFLRRKETEALEAAMRDHCIEAEPELLRWVFGAFAPKRAGALGRSRKRLKRLIERIAAAHKVTLRE